MVSDFVSEYVSLMSGLNDAPEEFHRASALYLLSTSVGTRWTFDSATDRSIFKEGKTWGRSLVLWEMLLGKTRITRKTSGVIKPVEEMLDTLQVFKLCNIFTKERIVSQLHLYKEEQQASQIEAAYILDECSLFFDLLRKTDYFIGMDALLSRLYDGRPYSHGTIKRGDEAIPRNHIPILFASTLDLPTRFKDDMLRQGFLNRFIFVVCDNKRKSKPLQNRSFDNTEKKQIEFLKDFLLAIRSTTSGVMFVLGKEAEMVYNQYEAKVDQKILENDLDIKEGYWGNLPNLVIRLSCLFHISKMKINEFDALVDDVVITLDGSDINDGILFVEEIVWSGFLKMMKLRRAEKEETRIKSSKYDLERFVDIACASEDGMIAISTIQDSLDAPDRTKIREVLHLGEVKKWFQNVKEEDLTEEQIERFKPQRGKFPLIFHITELGKQARG